ncbi:hypothetical protein HG537_0G01150 [Torulaspora globosa]|uniref:Uncharacterized protein n=1 Tax=Torulaspora globosa TaxID=48254 RepID=A0A7H9HWZ0_9SACH|nr:hypothetical protein HG537_0G01150 [Torulaspora sp. CBS 2947]
MDIDKLTIRDDQPLANSTTITREVRSESSDEDTITMFDVANRIELALKELESKFQDTDRQFETSLSALEDKISHWNE